MQHPTFADTGVRVSQMCLGTMMFGCSCDEAEATRIVDYALDHDVTFVDTAAVYAGGQTEEILGRALKGRRDRVFLTTKINVPSGADYPANIGPSLEASLRRLGTDYIDLYLLHWARREMDPPAIMQALGEVVKAGKARFVGCSNFPAWVLAHFNAAAAAVGVPALVNNQVPYNLIERGIEVEVLPQAIAENIAITCYRPLMMGLLSGKYRPGAELPQGSRAIEDDRIPAWLTTHGEGLQRFLQLADSRGVSPAQLAIAWIKDAPGVTCPIVGVSRLAHLEAGIGAFDITLADDERAALAEGFDTAVKEVSQYYGPLRRACDLIAR